MSSAGAVLWMSQAGRPGTSVRRNASPESPVSCPDPRGAAGDRIPPRRTSPRSRSDGAASGPRFCGFSDATPPGRCVRSGKRGAASRRSSVSSRRLWGAQFGGRRQSRPTQSPRLSEPWHCDDAGPGARTIGLRRRPRSTLAGIEQAPAPPSAANQGSGPFGCVAAGPAVKARPASGEIQGSSGRPMTSASSLR